MQQNLHYVLSLLVLFSPSKCWNLLCSCRGCIYWWILKLNLTSQLLETCLMTSLLHIYSSYMHTMILPNYSSINVYLFIFASFHLQVDMSSAKPLEMLVAELLAVSTKLYFVLWNSQLLSSQLKVVSCPCLANYKSSLHVQVWLVSRVKFDATDTAKYMEFEYDQSIILSVTCWETLK